MQTSVDVLCAGYATYDLVFSVGRHPLADEKLFSDAFLECGGGPAANAAVAVARLGLRSAFAGYLGNDKYGDLHLEEFKREKMPTELVYRGTDSTALTVAIVKPGGERTLISYRAQTSPLNPQTLDLEQVSFRAVLVDGYEPLIADLLVRKACEIGALSILDAGSVSEGTKSLLPQVDYAVCSEKFARDYSHCDDPREALMFLASKNENVALTLGERGLVFSFFNRLGRLPAFQIAARDTTGAGDVFHGAFAVSLLETGDDVQALRFASAVSAISCTRLGGRLSFPRRNEVQQYLDKHIARLDVAPL